MKKLLEDQIKTLEANLAALDAGIAAAREKKEDVTAHVLVCRGCQTTALANARTALEHVTKAEAPKK